VQGYLGSMREELLHFVWKHRKLPSAGLTTTSGQALKILNVGVHNSYSGPDFFNARLEIGGQLWAGNVEIHVKASDWYLHDHENDINYSNVILHVVWEEDIPVFHRDQTHIPALELKTYIPQPLLLSYRNLFRKNRHRFINCENDLRTVEPFLIAQWLERLYIERLENRSKEIETLLEATKNDWEKVLFVQLLKNFGLNVNGEAFHRLGMAIDFAVIRKIGRDTTRLESLLFGQSGLLEADASEDSYFRTLQREYKYLRSRFSLKDTPLTKPEFARLRPANFPTLRLSQFAVLYSTHGNLFSRVTAAGDLKEYYDIFSHSATTYWNTHYAFGTASRGSPKKISRPFIHLLVINTILPVNFCYSRQQGHSAGEQILRILAGIPAEKNRITERFAGLGLRASDAIDSQALLQLFGEYCAQNKCLHCAVGCRLLDGK
jgi:hypothetical protein